MRDRIITLILQVKEETQRRKSLLKVTAHPQECWCLNSGVLALLTSVLPTRRVFLPFLGNIILSPGTPTQGGYPRQSEARLSVVAEPSSCCHPYDTYSPSQHDSSMGWPGPPHCTITQHPLRQVLERPAITPTLPGARRVGMGIIKEEGDRPFFITENISHFLQASLW